MRSGLILNRLALEENLIQLTDGPEVRSRGRLTILLLCGGQKNSDLPKNLHVEDMSDPG